jgi:hypothetical protein
VQPHGGGALVAAVAYKASINNEKQRGISKSVPLANSVSLASFATLLRIHLELTLLSAENLDSDNLVILDHSFWGVLQAISRGLAEYKASQSEEKNANINAMLSAWRELFTVCLGNDGSFIQMIRNKRVISLSKTGISQYYINQLTNSSAGFTAEQQSLASQLNDRALLRHVLEPDEYTTPTSVFETVRATSSITTWNRGRFATPFERDDPFEARHAVLDEYGIPRDGQKEVAGRRLFVSYYRPHHWSRVYRIEFHEAMLRNKNDPPDYSGQGERFQKLLASVKQSVNPEHKEPLCQVLADIRAKAAVSSAMSMLPERTYYQLRERFVNNSELLDVIDTLTAEERT